MIGGHLDGWDLAEGATDDGVGVATTLGAAEAIMKSGFKPKRTMRFVLFTGPRPGPARLARLRKDAQGGDGEPRR